MTETEDLLKKKLSASKTIEKKSHQNAKSSTISDKKTKEPVIEPDSEEPTNTTPIEDAPVEYAIDQTVYDVKHPTGNTTRDKVRKLLHDALATDAPKSEEDENILKVANAIEEHMYNMFSDVGRDYKTKYRNISFNLKDKKNGKLRSMLLDRLLSPEELLNMTSEQLANDDLKKSRELVHEKMTRDAMPYNKQAATTDQFKCGKCKERKCTYYQMQTRSADEPLTTFVHCVNCDNRWRF